MVIYALVDGGCRFNQDPRKRDGYGSFLIVEGPQPFEMHYVKEIAHVSYGYGNRTSNECEYLIIADCLEFCHNNDIDIVCIGTDSFLVYSQLTGNWRTLDPKLIELRTKIKELISQMQTVEIQWVTRKLTSHYLGH